jgi:iron-sulfur cluster assembly protein
MVRVAVKGGGCSGFQNSLTLEEGEPSEKDTVYEVSGLKVVIDNRSAMYLTGTKLDFVDDLNRRGFKFDNPNATGKCGCGMSFSM